MGFSVLTAIKMAARLTKNRITRNKLVHACPQCHFGTTVVTVSVDSYTDVSADM